MKISTLTIEMAANVARLRRDMDNAQKVVDGAMGKIQSAAKFASGALAALGVGMAVSSIVNWTRQAINAADEAGKMASRVGLATSQVAGLQLAFELSGVQASQFAPLMAKVAEQAAKANPAFAAMGVATRDASGGLRGTRDLIADVADKFKGYQDGAAKTALAMQLFGEQGANLIPLLNDGSQALDEMDAKAKELGLTVDESTAKAAAEFNDTLAILWKSISGGGQEIAARLLPVLNTLAGQIVQVMSDTDALNKISQFLTATFKILYSVGLVVVKTFQALGVSLGSLIAALISASSGEFTVAKNIITNAFDEISAMVKDAANSMSEVWSEEQNAAIKSYASNIGAVREAQGKLPAPVLQTAAAFRAQAEASKSAAKAAKDLADIRTKSGAITQRAIDTAVEDVKSLRASNAALRDQIKRIGLTSAAMAALDAQKLQAQILDQQALVMAAQMAGADAVQIKAMQDKVDLLKEQGELMRDKQVKEAADEYRKTEASAWDQTWAQVSQSFVDQLMQGGKNVKEYLKDLFRTLVLRPILAPIGAAVGSMFSSGAMASSAAGGDMGSSLGVVSNIKSVYDTVIGGFAALGDSVAFAAQDLGAWMVQNTTGVLNSAGAELMANANAIGTAASYVGGVAAGIGLGTWISGDKAAFGDANIATVAGTAIGAVIAGPIGAAIGGALGGVFNQAFGMGSKQTRATGITGSFSAGGADVRTYADWYQEGGWFRSDRSGTNYGALDATLKAVLDGAVGATFAATKDYARVLGLATDNIGGFTQSIRLNLKGLSAADQEKAIADALSSFGDALVSSTLPQIAAFTKLGETTGAALARLGGSLRSVNQVFDTLNQTLLSGLAGGDAASKLLDLFGGAEGFVSSTSAYFQAYYTDAERAAIYTRQLGTAFASMGMALPSTIAAYRDLVDAQDLSTAAGRQAYAALMSLAPTFAEVAKTSQAAADAAAQEAKTKIDALRKSGQAISDWLGVLQGATTGGIVSLAMARRDYVQQLSLSRAGDVDALGQITGAASSYLDAAKAQARTGAEYRAIVAQVSAEMSALPVVRGWQDEVLAKLALINASTGAVGDYTSATETNTADAIDALKRQIEVTALLNNEGLFAVSTNTAKALDNQVSMISYLKSIDASNAAMSSKTASSGGGGGGGGGLISSIIGWLFADGAAFTGQGVYTQPTPFSFGGGKLGVMGEAGAEAVMPLQRTAGGRLGVSADNPALIAEMRALREQVDLLHAAMRATAVATTRTADLTKRVTRNGEGMVVQTDGTTVETVAA
jgi:hypothetical protein